MHIKCAEKWCPYVPTSQLLCFLNILCPLRRLLVPFYRPARDVVQQYVRTASAGLPAATAGETRFVYFFMSRPSIMCLIVICVSCCLPPIKSHLQSLIPTLLMDPLTWGLPLQDFTACGKSFPAVAFPASYLHER